MARAKPELPPEIEQEDYIEPSSVFLSEDWDIIDDDFYDLDVFEERRFRPWEDDTGC